MLSGALVKGGAVLGKEGQGEGEAMLGGCCHPMRVIVMVMVRLRD